MPYEIRESVPDPETFVALRDAVGMAPRSLEAARRGLPNTLFASSRSTRRQVKRSGWLASSAFTRA